MPFYRFRNGTFVHFCRPNKHAHKYSPEHVSRDSRREMCSARTEINIQAYHSRERGREGERASRFPYINIAKFIHPLFTTTINTMFWQKSLLFFCLWVLCNLYDPARSLDSAHIASENIAIYSTARRKRVSSGMRRILNAADNGKIHNNTQLFYSN